MSKFKLNLSLKNIKILKHSLERRIEANKEKYEFLNTFFQEDLTEESMIFIKEHEEHLRCLETLVEEMKSTGYRHGRNIFGSKYND
ncbi:hypothetical protein VOI00_001857 [Clostridium perfringens]